MNLISDRTEILVPQTDLGLDGSPLRGTVVAAFSGPGRRLWGGGRVRTSGPLKCGKSATKRSRMLSHEEKEGWSGLLTFITVGHQILQLTDGEWLIEVSPTLLFRFSALTYNAHRVQRSPRTRRGSNGRAGHPPPAG